MKKSDILKNLVLLLAAVQPLVDMDYLIFPFLDRFGLPRFSTVLRFLIIPALVLLSFWKRDTHKKGTFLCAFLYGAALLGYFVLHCRQAAELAVRLSFTENFRFGMFQELTYVLTLVMPFALIYLFANESFSRKDLKKVTVFETALITVTILLGDLFVFGRSTYYGYTVGNIFSWFTGIYEWYHPRTLASKFFFNEGNTIGILLFMLLPMMYYFFAESESGKERRRLGALIIGQSIAMMMLSTRVATYGVIFVPLLFAVLYVIEHFKNKTLKVNIDTLVFMLCAGGYSAAMILLEGKKAASLVSVLMWGTPVILAGCALYIFARRKKLSAKHTDFDRILVFCGCAAVLFAGILDRTPAIQNQKVDAKNDTALLHNGMASMGEAELKNAEDLIPGTPEYINFYVYMFETYGINARYIQSVPSMYYTEYYSYQFDPKFWVDVTFMPVFDRVSGRQIETIFFNYKYAGLSSKEKLLGMGYSTFMNGSIVLEQDFKQQIYTLGYIGEILCVMPWLAVILYGVFWYIRRFAKMFTLENNVMAVSIALALGSAWLSGHVLDQFVTSAFMALLAAILLNKVKEA